MRMENLRLNCRKASFTVEAVFVVSIVVWIVVSICYLSVFTHDQTALFSLTQSYVEQAVENGSEFTEDGLRAGLMPYISSHMMLCRIDNISVKKRLMSVDVDLEYTTQVQFPFAGKLLSAGRPRRIRISHEVLFAPYRMWSMEVDDGD